MMKIKLALALLLAPLWAARQRCNRWPPCTRRSRFMRRWPCRTRGWWRWKAAQFSRARRLSRRRGPHGEVGLLYRSGSMSGLTAADYATLEKRGIRVVCDLRDSRERAAEPVAWPGEPGRGRRACC
jgi:hypothetical protein